jgi:hypothetical protein
MPLSRDPIWSAGDRKWKEFLISFSRSYSTRRIVGFDSSSNRYATRRSPRKKDSLCRC